MVTCGIRCFQPAQAEECCDERNREWYQSEFGDTLESLFPVVVLKPFAMCGHKSDEYQNDASQARSCAEDRKDSVLFHLVRNVVIPRMCNLLDDRYCPVFWGNNSRRFAAQPVSSQAVSGRVRPTLARRRKRQRLDLKEGFKSVLKQR
jgi:hypothetical protein